jgi:hypothetical protein
VSQRNFEPIEFGETLPSQGGSVFCAQGQSVLDAGLISNLPFGFTFSAGRPTLTGDGWIFDVVWLDLGPIHIGDIGYFMICADVAT